MKNNYYSIMELFQERDGIIKTYAYVAAKCELIEKNEISLCTGKQQTQYQVVFTWNESQDDISPIFENGQCINSTIVTEIYTKLSDCQKKVSELNDLLVRTEIKNATISDARDIAKTLRANLEKAESLQNKHLNKNVEIIK